MIGALAEWTLLRPWWLLALPLAALLHHRQRRRIEGLGGWRAAVDPRLMAALACAAPCVLATPGPAA
jgi:Ca-activated chloride channel family protein